MYELDILKEFLRKKRVASFPERVMLISEQRQFLQKLEDNELLEFRLISRIIDRVRQMELTKEFNITEQEFDRILKEKYVEENVFQAFANEIAVIKDRIARLKELLEMQSKSDDPRFLLDEQNIYSEMESAMPDIGYLKEKVLKYLNDIRNLKYDKRAIRTGQIVSKVIGKGVFRIKVQGIENIPERGPCILAVRHYHFQYDQFILMAIISRPLFFLATSELFVSAVGEKILDKVGAIPVNKDYSSEDHKSNWWNTNINFRFSSPEKVKKFEKEHNVMSGALKKPLIHLKYGDAIVIFPEGDPIVFGTYERNGKEFLRPNEGYVWIAYYAKKRHNVDVPIIPVGIDYSGLIPVILYRSAKVAFGEPFFIPEDIFKLEGAELKNAILAISERVFGSVIELSKK